MKHVKACLTGIAMKEVIAVLREIHAWGGRQMMSADEARKIAMWRKLTHYTEEEVSRHEKMSGDWVKKFKQYLEQKYKKKLPDTLH